MHVYMYVCAYMYVHIYYTYYTYINIFNDLLAGVNS